MSVIGLRVGPFEIEEAVVVPEPGEWYRARRAGMKRRQPTEVLVKLPGDGGPGQFGLQHQFEVLRSLDDQRLPTAVAFYEGSGALALSAPVGCPLTSLVEARRLGAIPMTPTTLLDLALDLSEVLQHAHHRGRRHGHLSPDCIWIAPDGRICLWGLGLHGDASDGWIAPERVRGQPATEWTDQWSFAAILASLVTGASPWESLAEARRGDPSCIVAPVEEQWPAFGRLLRRMLDAEPANRFPNLHPIRQSLLALSRKAGGVGNRRELGQAVTAWHKENHTPAPPEAMVILADDEIDHDSVETVRPMPTRSMGPATDASDPGSDAGIPEIEVMLQASAHVSLGQETPHGADERLDIVAPEVASNDEVPYADSPSFPFMPSFAAPEPEPAEETELMTEFAPTEMLGPVEDPSDPSVIEEPPPIRPQTPSPSPSRLPVVRVKPDTGEKEPEDPPSIVMGAPELDSIVELQDFDEPADHQESLDFIELRKDPLDPPTCPNPEFFGELTGPVNRDEPPTLPPISTAEPQLEMPRYATAMVELIDDESDAESLGLGAVDAPTGPDLGLEADDDVVGDPWFIGTPAAEPEVSLPVPKKAWVLRVTPWVAASSMGLLALYTAVNIF